MTDQTADEPQFGTDHCTCVPFTRQTDPPRILNRPTDTVDMISGWEIGRDCPHHRSVGQAPTPDRTAVLAAVKVISRRLAAHAVGFQDVLDDTDCDPWARTVGADITALCTALNGLTIPVLPASVDRATEVEAPLSPHYEHPECGFHWHGGDGMDIPMRDGQPVCPRCELAKVQKHLDHSLRRREEVGEECKRRGRIKLEQAECIVRLERELDGVRDQLGKEMLRADDAEAGIRRMADGCPQCGGAGACNGGPCPLATGPAAVVSGRAADETQGETVHACPPDGSGLTPCCGRTPFELPPTDRMTSTETVTCTPAVGGAQQPTEARP